MNQPVHFSLCGGSLSPKLGFVKKTVLAAWLAIVSVLSGQSKASAQNYPPAVNIMGISGPDTIPGSGSGSGGLIPGPTSPIILSGGAGNYSGSYYSQYSYSVDNGFWDYSQGDWVTTYDGYWDNSQGYWNPAGYWDTSAGHWDYSNCTWDANAGYWDQTTGYYVDTQDYDADGNLVTTQSWMQSPTWVPTPQWNGTPTWVVDPSWVSVPVWVSQPVWVPTQTSTWVVRPVWMSTAPSTTTVSQLIAVNLSINSDGSATVSIHNNDTGNNNSWTGTYDFANGGFSGELPSTWGINNDGSLWTPPPPPPPYASFGPSAIWVDGTLYSWSYSSFDNDAETSGTDFYLDGSGQPAWVMGNPQSGYSAGGTAPSGAPWSAHYYSGVFETDGADVRAADAGGNWALRTPPSELPFALRVDGSLSLWRFIGFGSMQYYAGPNAGDRIAINGAGDVYVLGSAISGLYLDGVVWMPKEGRDVRAVSPDGSLRQPDSLPVTGPTDVWVNNTVWRFAGTWSQQSSFPAGSPPADGDYYLGDNAGQQLVIDPSGTVTVNNLTQTFAGSYLNTAEGFDVTGITVFPGDVNGAYHTVQPTTGPPAIIANGTSFQFLGSNPDASGTAGLMVDSYGDGTDARIQITASSVSYFGADGSLLWSGAYIASSADPVSGGIFVATTGNSLTYDIRASTGAAYLQSGGSPQASHPPVVKLDGIFLRYGGSTGGNNPKDYYTGAAAGQWLSIDSTGNVAFPVGTSSISLSSTTMLVGNVFLTGSGHDLRTCTSDNLPFPPADTPHWGPPAVWVQDAPWNYLGTVSDEALTIHADYYAGANQGQVLWLASDGSVVQPPDLTTVLGTYNHGVFQDVASGTTLAAGGVTMPDPVSGHPDVLTVNGVLWQRSTLSDGTLDIYLGPQSGQQLSIDGSGAVSYLDTPIGILEAIGGTFSGGQLDFAPILPAAQTAPIPSTISGPPWTAVTSPPVQNGPAGLGQMILLSDGTVMVLNCNNDSNGGTYGPAWYRLTPDASGSYVHGTWAVANDPNGIQPMHDTRLFFASQVLKDGHVFVAGGEYSSGIPGTTGTFGTARAEVYDPVANTWTQTAPNPTNAYTATTTAASGDGTNATLTFAAGTASFYVGQQVTVTGVAPNGYNTTGNTPWIITAQTSSSITFRCSAQGTQTTSGTISGQMQLSDANSAILPDGRILITVVDSNSDLQHTRIYDPVHDTWIDGPTCKGIHNESAWVKLPDNSILFVDRGSSATERYIPASNSWILDKPLPTGLNLYTPAMSKYGDECGPSILLPNGNSIAFGGTGKTAIYTPSGDTTVGRWVAGPNFPLTQQGDLTPLPTTPGPWAGAQPGMPDAPAAIMPNGKILCVTSATPTNSIQNNITGFFEYDYTGVTGTATGAFTRVPAPSGYLTEGGYCYNRQLLVLPDGTLLYSNNTTQLYVYSSPGTPNAAWRPTITSITANRDASNNIVSYHLTGTRLNGISEGSCFGDDMQNATNYPIVRLTAGTNVYYARTFNWSNTGVVAGSSPVANDTLMTTDFTLPSGLALDDYTIEVIANGIPSLSTPQLAFNNPNINSRVATLSALTVSAGTLPAFASTTFGYAFDVTDATTSLSVTPTATRLGATIKVKGVSTASGQASGSIQLNDGINTIPVVVTAPDGTTLSIYTLTVTRVSASNADLNALTVSAGTLLPAFSIGTTSYAFSVPDSTTSMTVTPTTRNSQATVKVNGVLVTSGQPSNSLALALGVNTITVLVTSSDGTTTSTYTLTVTRTNLPNATTSTATNASIAGDVRMQLNGTVSANGASTTVKFQYGPTPTYGTEVIPSQSPITTDNTAVSVLATGLSPATAYHFRIVATNSEGTTTTDDATFTTRNNVATLSGLSSSVGTLTPAFTVNTLLYTISVVNATSTLTIKPTITALSNATVKVNGNPVASATSSSAIGLNIGSNSIPVEVTADDGITTRTYTVTINRAYATPVVATTAATSVTDTTATLNGTVNALSDPLQMDGATVYFEYGTSSTNYGLRTSSVTVTDSVVTPVSAQITGLSSAKLYYFRIHAIGKNGSGSTALGGALTFTTQNNLSTLANLALNGATLTGFGSATQSYSANVANTVTSVTVTPTASQLPVTITVGSTSLLTPPAVVVVVPPATVASGSAKTIPLNIGHNVISVEVDTIPGPSTTYTVDVFRATAAPVVVTGAPTAVGSSTATVAGTVDPNSDGVAEHGATVSFEYRAPGASAYSSVTLTIPPVTGTTATPVSAILVDLAPGTIYSYHVKASTSIVSGSYSSTSTASGTDKTFTTTQNAIYVETYPATNVTNTTATLSGVAGSYVQPLPPPSPTNYNVVFDYGLTAAYGTTVIPTPSIITNPYVPGLFPQPVPTANLTGLSPGTYHYRIRAYLSPGVGVSTGADMTFTIHSWSLAATLSNLVISDSVAGEGALFPAFSPATTNYSTTVTCSTINITPTATTPASVSQIQVNVPVDGNATLGVTGSGTSTAIVLSLGLNRIPVQVWDTSGNIDIYILNVTCEAPLANLLLNNGNPVLSPLLSPQFSDGIRSYTAVIYASSVLVTAYPTGGVGSVAISNGQSSSTEQTVFGQLQGVNVNFPIGGSQTQMDISIQVSGQPNTGPATIVHVTRVPAIMDWRLAKFGSTTNSGSGADMASYSGDGISNLIKYAFGFNPLVAYSPSAVLPSVVVGSTNPLLDDRLAVTFQLPNPAPSDVNYWVYGSSGGSWTEIAGKTGAGGWFWNSSSGGTGSHVVETNIGSTTTVQVGDSVPTGGNPFRMIMVQVEAVVDSVLLNTSTTPALAAVTLPVPSGRSTIAPPLVNPAIFIHQSVFSNSTTITPTTAPNWIPGAYAEIPDYPAYYAEVTSGTYAGYVFDIIGNSASALTISACPPALIGQTVTVTLRHHMTLDQLVVGATGNLANATVSFNNSNITTSTRTYTGGAWVDGNGNPAGQTIVYPGEGFIINSSAVAALNLTGNVKTSVTAIPLYPGMVNLVGPLNPLTGGTLLNSPGLNLAPAMQSASDFIAAYPIDGSFAPSVLYHSDGTAILDSTLAPLSSSATDAILGGRAVGVTVSLFKMWISNPIFTQ